MLRLLAAKRLSEYLFPSHLFDLAQTISTDSATAGEAVLSWEILLGHWGNCPFRLEHRFIQDRQHREGDGAVASVHSVRVEIVL